MFEESRKIPIGIIAMKFAVLQANQVTTTNEIDYQRAKLCFALLDRGERG